MQGLARIKSFISTTRFKTALWYSLVFLVLEILLGIIVYFFLYNTLLSRLDYSLKTQASAILRTVTEKHLDIDNFMPDSIYQSKEDMVWDIIYDDVAFNLRNNFIQISFKNKIIFKSGNLADDTLSFGNRNKPLSIFDFSDTSLSPNNIRCVILRKDNYKIIVAFPKDHITATLNSLTDIYAILAPLLFIVSLLGGSVIAAKSLSRIDAVIKKTEEITAQNLDEKIEGEEYSDEYGRLVRRMNQMILRIKTSLDYTNQFSLSAAHELKTPLTILRGETEIALKSRKTPEEYIEVLKSNYEEILRLIKIIDNLFFISKIDHSLINIKKADVSLDSFLRSIVKNMGILGKDKKIRLVLHSDSDAIIKMDPGLMMQAISNIVDNAIKYGDENEEVIISGENLNADKIKINVTNKGEGIAAESLEKIFDRFYRVDTSRNRDTGGAGLGLSVVKAIIDRHGAEINVCSNENRETTFSIIMNRS